MEHQPLSGQPVAGYNTQHGVNISQPQPGAPPGGFPPGQQGQGWMQRPEGFSGCPRGMEYLTQIDQLVVKQQVDLMEMMTGWEQANKYQILNSVGQQVYFAVEESDACMRQCCGSVRGFTIHITDNMGQEIMQVTREFKCCAGCCWCACSDGCAMEVTTKTTDGTVLGKIRQECSAWKPSFSIRNPDDDVVAVIQGPCCQCSGPCCSDVEFIIMNKDETSEIGKISKKWTGYMEAFTDADTFSVSFPMDMDVRMKANFIGALFLIDFMYFEQSSQNNDQHH